MATTRKTPKAAQIAFDPQAHYEVQVTGRADWKGKPLPRSRRIVLRGDVCEAVRDKIADVRPL